MSRANFQPLITENWESGGVGMTMSLPRIVTLAAAVTVGAERADFVDTWQL